MSSTVPRQVVQKFQAGVVAPMQILNNQQHRLFCSKSCKELRQGSEDAAFLLFRLNWY